MHGVVTGAWLKNRLLNTLSFKAKQLKNVLGPDPSLGRKY